MKTMRDPFGRQRTELMHALKKTTEIRNQVELPVHINQIDLPSRHEAELGDDRNDEGNRR
jgi:hypothetical protein